MTTDERRPIHAYLSPKAHEQWHDTCATQRVSVSVMLEAMVTLPLPERQRAEHLLHLQVMAAQCRHAARCLPHKPSREAAQRNLETIEWALAQLKTPKPKAKPKVVVEPPPDDLWDRIDPGTGAA